MPALRLTNYRTVDPAAPREIAVVEGRFALPQGGEAELDLGGKWLLPKWIDNHCHILPTGLDLRKLDLGTCTTREQVLDLVLEESKSSPEGWLHAVRYDPTALPEGTAPTRQDLDAISATQPILLRYVSGHASLANSAALNAAGVDENTPNPPGGEYVKDPSGKLNGILTEDAHERVTAAMPKPTREEMTLAILEAGRSMAGYGIGTASDMMTGRFSLTDEIAAYADAAKRGNPIRVRLYVQYRDVFGSKGIGVERLRELMRDLPSERVAVRGIKLFADGAIGSATAAIYGSYADQEPGGPILSRGGLTLSGNRAGQLIYSPERLTAMTKTASDAGFPVAIHAIGDYACDLVMDAFEATGTPDRHRIEHAMMLSDAQIERLAKLNPYVTMQPEFLSAFGHLYSRRLGEERTAALKRFRSIREAGLRLSLSSDRPIVSGDPRIGIHAATSRPSPSETLTREEAIEGYTRAGAEANGDAGLVGEIRPGRLADYQVLDDLP